MTAARQDSALVVGDLVLDEDSHEVRRGDTPVELTATEFELLRFLMRNPRRVLSQGADPRPGVELRLRRPVQRRRALHLLPAQEDRRRPRADDPHRARRGLRAQARRGMSTRCAPRARCARGWSPPSLVLLAVDAVDRDRGGHDAGAARSSCSAASTASSPTASNRLRAAQTGQLVPPGEARTGQARGLRSARSRAPRTLGATIRTVSCSAPR